MKFTKPQLKALTGLRFVAAIHVVLYHAVPREWLDGHPWLYSIINRGPASVGLFFMLSGFILTYTYFDSFGDPKLDRGKFGRARFARIYPVYALSIVVALPYKVVDLYRELGADVVGIITGLSKQVVPMALLVHAWYPDTVYGINAAAWSLSVEAFFYLMFTLIAGSVLVTAALKRPFLSMVVLYILAVLPAWLYFNYPQINTQIPTVVIAHNPLVRLPDFLIGIVLGDLFLRVKRSENPSRLSGFAAISHWIPLLATLGIGLFFVATGNLEGALVRALVLPLFAFLIWGLAFDEGRLSKGLSTKTMILLGGASYSLYILHLPLFLIWKSLVQRVVAWPANSPQLMVSYVIFVVAISIATFLFVEEPMRSYLRSRSRRRA